MLLSNPEYIYILYIYVLLYTILISLVYPEEIPIKTYAEDQSPVSLSASASGMQHGAEGPLIGVELIDVLPQKAEMILGMLIWLVMVDLCLVYAIYSTNNTNNSGYSTNNSGYIYIYMGYMMGLLIVVNQ